MVKNRFEIDPNLPLKDMEFISKDFGVSFAILVLIDGEGSSKKEKQEANLQVANI